MNMWHAHRTSLRTKQLLPSSGQWAMSVGAARPACVCHSQGQRLHQGWVVQSQPGLTRFLGIKRLILFPLVDESLALTSDRPLERFRRSVFV